MYLFTVVCWGGVTFSPILNDYSQLWWIKIAVSDTFRRQLSKLCRRDSPGRAPTIPSLLLLLLPSFCPRPGGLFYQPQLRNQSGTSSLTTPLHLNSAHFSRKLIDLLNVTAAETGCWFTQEESQFLLIIFFGDFCWLLWWINSPQQR